MITRWTEIAKRAAEKLGVTQSQVKAAMEDYAKKIAEHASHPTVLETDLLGIGTLECRYGKLIKRVEHLKGIIRVRERLRDGPESRGKPRIQEIRDRHDGAIASMRRDIEVFEEFIAQKHDIYTAFGRARYIKETMENNDLTRSDLTPLKKKAYLGKPPESRAFKKIQREKEKEQRRRDRELLRVKKKRKIEKEIVLKVKKAAEKVVKEPRLRNGKRRAKRIKGWIHPDLRL